MRLSSNPKMHETDSLMVRGGMRISEVLKLTASDVEDRKLIIRDAKSGKAVEHVFIPQKIADRLKQYILEKGFGPDVRIFSMTYAGAGAMVVRAGNRGGIIGVLPGMD